jgi:hypothetical protein
MSAVSVSLRVEGVVAWVWLGCALTGFACGSGHKVPVWRKRVGGALAAVGAVAFTGSLIVWLAAQL